MPPDLGVWGQDLSDAYKATRQTVVNEAAGNWRQRAQIKRLRYSHEDCIDRIIANPGIREDELAIIYGVTKSWMTIVINSDAFKVKLAERRDELIDPVLQARINEHYAALAVKSVGVLIEKMNRPVDQIPDKLALEAAALGAKVMGLGEERAPSGNAVDHLAALAHRLVDLNKPTTVHTIEGETRRVD